MKLLSGHWFPFSHSGCSCGCGSAVAAAGSGGGGQRRCCAAAVVVRRRTRQWLCRDLRWATALTVGSLR